MLNRVFAKQFYWKEVALLSEPFLWVNPEKFHSTLSSCTSKRKLKSSNFHTSRCIINIQKHLQVYNLNTFSSGLKCFDQWEKLFLIHKLLSCKPRFWGEFIFRSLPFYSSDLFPLIPTQWVESNSTLQCSTVTSLANQKARLGIPP